ncbi:hypothetical protein MUB24_07605 [Lederbergia sp. NSJ-179]|uniref:hypothetical protein n=1 Tax=Lederbergia sp. NSJ-179 TaxID=2931402 RepID=UPI001FD514C1|nr:hypothetical protein [Lederbergia sp. NSJ-179]MCJ7840772.1 hypothetical protein [Lederbergia sp. NSJ-179]
MRKKVISMSLIMAAILFIMSPSAFAAKKNFSFNVNPSANNGVAYTAPNPKDDNEQKTYIYTQKHNIISSDRFYYNVRKSASTSSTSYTGYIRVTPSNASRIVKSYSPNAGGKGTNLVLQADTDEYNVTAEGYWYS